MILRLDNSANLYPMLTSKKNQNIFRLCCDLKEEIDPVTLEQAINLVLPRFKCLSMKLMRGFFWYYLADNDKPYPLREENGILFDAIDMNNLDGYNMRISYYGRRISIEFYHVICDGAGGFELLKSLLHAYLYLKGHKLPSTNILAFDTLPDPNESEDSFNKNYIKLPLKECKISDLKGSKAFIIEGDYFKRGKTTIILKTDSYALLNLARARNATVTEYLTAIFVRAIKNTYGNVNSPCNIMLPINLRKIFGSNTIRNFSLFSRVSLDASADIDENILITHDCLVRDTDKERLSKKISTTVRGEKFPPLRYIPLFIKKTVFMISNIFVGKSKRTATLSNLGVIKLDKEFSEYIDCFYFALNSNKPTPINIAVCTYENTASICFTNAIADNNVIAEFAKLLIAEGLEIIADGNYWSEVASD